MSNPNNAVGTNGAFGGRTSVNALNDVLATFTGSGVLSGWAIEPKSGMSVEVGGASGLRDVAVAQDNNGNRTTIDNISQSPIQVEMASAPSTGSRIDAIVGYVENPPQGSATVIDNPSACGVMAVSGTASSSPTAPTENVIRTALTSAGINGATAYIAVLGYVTIPAGTTDIDSTMIGGAQYTGLDVANQIPDGGISANKVDFATIDISTDVTPSNNRSGFGYGERTIDISSYNVAKILSWGFTATSSFMLWSLHQNGVTENPTSISICGYRVGGTYGNPLGTVLRLLYIPKS